MSLNLQYLTKVVKFEAITQYVTIKTNITMKKTNWYINIGAGFIALAILLKVLNLEYNVSLFMQGFSFGLGLVLIVRGFLIKREEAKKQL